MQISTVQVAVRSPLQTLVHPSSKACAKSDSVSSIKISTSKPNQVLYTLTKQPDAIISRSEPITNPLDEYSKSVTAGKSLMDRGDEEYIKVLKQAIVEVINENELVLL